MLKYIVAIYLRLSIDDKKVESMSIESQRNLLRKHAELLGYDDIEIIEYVDNGYSGTNFERPAVQRLLEDIKAFRVNCVMVKDFSRFGRNSIEVGYFTQQVFPLFNVRFISVGDYYDSDEHKGDTGGLEVTFKYLVNEYYSKDLSMKVKSAKHLKMRTGEYVNGVYCYGYTTGKNREMVVDENTAPVVRLMFEMASNGNSTSDIIKELHKRNIPTPAQYKKIKAKNYNLDECKYWDKAQICRMLRDEQYTGTYIMGKFQKQEVGSNRVTMNDESEWYKIPNHHQEIISQELFDKVQTVRGKRKTPVKSTLQYPLKSKVVCGCCNHTMCYKHKFNHTFQCRYTYHDETEPCYKHKINESDLHAVLFEIISKQAEVILNVDSLSDVDKIKIKTEHTAELEKQIESYQQKKRELYEQLLMKEISTDEYMQQKSKIDVLIKNITAQYNQSKQEVDQTMLDAQSKSQATEIAKAVQKENTLTQALADMLIDKVYVYPDNRIEVVWKIKDFCTENMILATA